MGTAKQKGQEVAQETGPPAGRGRSPGSRRTQFPPGVSPNPGGRPTPRPEEDDGLGADEWRRMRRVYGQPASADLNSAQRLLRKLLDKDTKGYIRLMTSLERTAGGGAGRATPAEAPPPAGVDEGQERALALIEELLAEARQDGPSGSRD